VKRRVLAIGLDAAEPALIRRMIGEGHLPALGALLEAGCWKRVLSPAHIGSGTVWPTFMTGTDAAAHGIYGEWSWNPESMTPQRFAPTGFEPFWDAAAARGAKIALIDVPFAPVSRRTNITQVSEWGAHDAFFGKTEFWPASAGEEAPVHPFAAESFDQIGPFDGPGLSAIAESAVDGVALRGAFAARLLQDAAADLSIVVFPEIHHAAHRLWHTADPAHPHYDETLLAGRMTLADVVQEVDRQIAVLLGALRPDAVLVFSLHGMRPGWGIRTALGDLLLERGFARRAGWESQSWRERARSLFAKVKRSTPAALKNFYYRTAPRDTVRRLAEPTMIPSYDWSATRAFALPSDQHGWIRINLAGRERKGVVAPDAYGATLDEVETMLRACGDVQDVIRLARDAAQAATLPLPDLVVHWSDAGLETPLAPEYARRAQTGQHAADGFLIAHDLRVEGDTVQACDLHRLLI
jgi:predicted AlkP superfamily phosphohydrolase/phosphomutase